VITHKEPRYFEFAIFGNDQVTVGNGTVTVKADSYTSDDGSYGGSNVTQNADIGTNSTAADAVTILPQGEVHGNVQVGCGAAAPDLCVDNKGIITGEISALDNPSNLPSITSFPSGAIELGDVWLDYNQELVLNEGTYHMTDLDVFGSAQVTCNGKVVIYIDQTTDTATPDVRVGGNGIVNTSQIPANLIIYCASDVTKITISGNGAVYGGIYAPNAAITISSGQVFGSVVGRTVTLNGANSHIHYDEALRDHVNPNAVIRSWEVF
jgi:cytoskeletal protein CcmA (bactofilin family)